MFVDTNEGDQLFPSLVEGLWTLWICVTTANYPDVMMPGYNDNRWVAIYFVSFMVITFFFLMNIILAAVVNEYDSNVDERRTRQAEYARTCLQKAYRLLTQQEADNRALKSESGEALAQSTVESGSPTHDARSNNSPREQIDKKTVMDLFEILNSGRSLFSFLCDFCSLCCVEKLSHLVSILPPLARLTDFPEFRCTS